MYSHASRNEKSERNLILGIDMGSVSLSLVITDLSGVILRRIYLLHHGRIRNTLLEALEGNDPRTFAGIAAVQHPSVNPDRVAVFNTQVALVSAAKKLVPEARSLLQVGAEKFMIIRLDRNGGYESAKTNSSCAAGTGTFLDQQAFRLNLTGIGELCEKALANTDPVPEIASRCAVFAKTDLIHAQQQGYSPGAICDSLCKGLAKNITDTLFSREGVTGPVLITGGVAKNGAVIRHLEAQLDVKFLSHPDSHLFGAIGAAGLLEKNPDIESIIPIQSLEEILLPEETGRNYFYEPLLLKNDGYPSFSSHQSDSFLPVITNHPVAVEYDIYQTVAAGQTTAVFLGIDIGSTSTKAILLDDQNKPVAGFYTYTSGKPLDAIRSIFEALEELGKKSNGKFEIIAAGTTGSGRKFIGKIIGADLIVDEITAHARAAYELNPATDTIIEIGGQDAKFTVIKNGVVTFSQMNAVCAAGTGSFIEEQAKKLGCSLADYSERCEGRQAPLASDRCTVFMERDINHLLNRGYQVEEVLATVLHSVRENYLKKVAIEASIGVNICFQGATARNRSLVAAFEQRLNKKIFVSEYCHLTGALGTALILSEERRERSKFRGTALCRETIPVRTEVCRFCQNHCRISHATVAGETESYGFLCGRDNTTQKYVHTGASGFNLLEERKKLFRVVPGEKQKSRTTIGIPASLHLFEELPLWKKFFANLGMKIITSEDFLDPIREGKRIAGAEFCAPIDSIYGHVAYLADKVDYIFLPFFLEAREKPEGTERLYCYYTQYSASLVFALKEKLIQEKLISPLLIFKNGKRKALQQLHAALAPVAGFQLSPAEVKAAFEEAEAFYTQKRESLTGIFRRELNNNGNISVVLLGRPYVVLSESVNKGIPDLFNGMGVKTFYQDMIPSDEPLTGEMERVLKTVPWHFAAGMLQAARIAATTPNLYPVLVTALKCSPDAFIIDFFCKMMYLFGKPYLILQIDDHDSSVGYETRIEAAVRSFRNHARSQAIAPAAGFDILPRLETKLNGKTLLFPNWDPLASPLVAANLRRLGIDARAMTSDETIIRKSMVHNMGQCLPVNIMAQEFIDYVERNNLDPEKTVMWMARGWIACNLRFYPQYIKNLFENYGKGFEKAGVYRGEISHLEISVGAGYHAYFAYLLSGLIRKTGCRIRPYEVRKGETDRVIGKSLSILEEAFLGNRLMDEAVSSVAALFDAVESHRGKRPGVAIFGDLYVRDNDVMNQNLIGAIEDAGGEAITTPYTDIVKLNIENTLRRAAARGEYFNFGLYRGMISTLKLLEGKYYRQFGKFVGKKPVINPKRLEKNLASFNIKPYHSGESYENILKIFYILENYPDIRLFVQTNPAFCCPSLVTEAMTQDIRRITGIPVVTITYDGTSEYKNDVIAPYLQQSMV